MSFRPLLTVLALTAAAIFLATPGTAQEDCSDDVCAWRSGDIAANEKYSHTFETAHEFSYHCHPHPWMQGTVVVQPAEEGHEPTTHQVAIREGDDQDDWAFFPADITIQVGDTVVWTNGGQTVHEVMAFEGAEQAAAHGGGAHAHDHGEAESEEAPGPAAVAAVGMLAVIVAVVRRRD